MTSSTSLYARYPLNAATKQIRVLSVHASRLRDQDDSLCASLSIVDVTDSRHKYAALSYVWGPVKPSQPTIRCDDVDIAITHNCHEALMNLRRKLGNFSIWVDAICINQMDDTEKGRQMAFMPDIYSSASCVYIWLGPGSTDKNKAMSYLGTSKLRQHITSDGNKSSDQPYGLALRLMDPQGSAYPSRKESNRASAENLYKLLSNEWLQRMWTYQEVLFANNPFVVCGTQHVRWSTFEDQLLLLSSVRDEKLRNISVAWSGLGAARERLKSDHDSIKFSRRQSFMREVLRARLVLRIILWFVSLTLLITTAVIRGILNITQTENEGPSNILNVIAVVSGIYNVWEGYTIHRSLQTYWHERSDAPSAGSLVEGISQRRATHDKDMVYGVCSILRRLGAKNLPEESYAGEPLDDLYWRLAIGLLEVGEDLSLLHIAAAQPMQNADTPTWVPDWALQRRVKLGVEQDLLIVDTMGNRIASRREIIDMRAEEARKHKFRLDPARKVLNVLAHELGTVHDCMVFSKMPATLSADNIQSYISNLILASKIDALLRKLGSSMASLLTSGASSWANSLQHNNFRRPTEDYSQIYASKTPAFWTTHVQACNVLAELGLSVCTVRMSGHPTRKETMGLCSSQTQEGDTILRIQSVLQPLIVRKSRHSSTSVALVSTLTMEYRKARGGAITQPPAGQRYDIH